MHGLLCLRHDASCIAEHSSSRFSSTKKIIADPTWEEQSTLDDHDYRASGDRRKEHVSSVGGGMKKLSRGLSPPICIDKLWGGLRFRNCRNNHMCRIAIF